MRKLARVLLAILVVSMFILAAGCSTNKEASKNSGESNQEPVKVRFALDTAAGASYQFRVAAEKGFFQNLGIEPVISDFAWGIDTMNAMLLGNADFGLGADYALLNTVGKGDLKVASLTSTGNTAWSKLFAKEDISKPEDLKGKKLGIQKGTVFEYVWAKFLEKNGIDSSEVEFRPIQTPAETAAALERGDIDAAWFSGAFIPKAQKIQGSKELSDLSTIGFNIRGYILVTGSFASKNPEVTAKVFKALDEATKFIKANPEETAEILFKTLKLPKEDVLKELTLDPDKLHIRFYQEDFDHLLKIKEWATEKGNLKENYDLKEKIAVEPLKEIFPQEVTYNP